MAKTISDIKPLSPEKGSTMRDDERNLVPEWLREAIRPASEEALVEVKPSNPRAEQEKAPASEASPVESPSEQVKERVQRGEQSAGALFNPEPFPGARIVLIARGPNAGEGWVGSYAPPGMPTRPGDAKMFLFAKLGKEGAYWAAREFCRRIELATRGREAKGAFKPVFRESQRQLAARWITSRLREIGQRHDVDVDVVNEMIEAVEERLLF